MSTLDRPADRQVTAPAEAGPGPAQTRFTEAPPSIPELPEEPRRPSCAGTAQLVLRGELSRADRSWLRPKLKELVASGAQTIEIDLSAVTDLDPAIARLLLLTNWRLGDTPRKLRLLRPQLPVRHLLQWYGGDHLIVR